jgi:hypothetical protein
MGHESGRRGGMYWVSAMWVWGRNGEKEQGQVCLPCLLCYYYFSWLNICVCERSTGNRFGELVHMASPRRALYTPRRLEGC